jgi:hypothetical protein
MLGNMINIVIGMICRKEIVTSLFKRIQHIEPNSHENRWWYVQN